MAFLKLALGLFFEVKQWFNCASQSLRGVVKTLRVSTSEGLQWCLRTCFSNEFLDGADDFALGLENLGDGKWKIFEAVE